MMEPCSVRHQRQVGDGHIFHLCRRSFVGNRPETSLRTLKQSRESSATTQFLGFRGKVRFARDLIELKVGNREAVGEPSLGFHSILWKC